MRCIQAHPFTDMLAVLLYYTYYERSHFFLFNAISVWPGIIEIMNLNKMSLKKHPRHSTTELVRNVIPHRLTVVRIDSTFMLNEVRWF